MENKLHDQTPLVMRFGCTNELAIQTAEDFLDSDVGLSAKVDACEVLLAVRAPTALSRVTSLLSGKLIPSDADIYHAPNLASGHIFQCAINALPSQVADICESATRSPFMEVVQMGIKAWTQDEHARQDARFYPTVVRLLKHESIPVQLLALHIAGENINSSLHEHLWHLMEHPDSQVVQAVASALSRLGNVVLPQAASALETSNAYRRVAIVSMLEAILSDESLGLLWKQWESEQDDAVIDRLLAALERRTGGIRLTKAQIAERVTKTLPRTAAKPVPWLDLAVIEIFRQDGSKLTVEELRYLCHRQSHCQEMRADPEAAPLYEKMDRHRNSPVALAVVEGFLGSKQKIVDRWVLAWAALIGDDALVPVFTQAIKRWVDIHRNRHAECAAVALSLIGSNRALSAMDSVSLVYRAKKPNVALAAAEAFSRVADERGVSVEKLGDLIVPSHGFNPDGFQGVEGATSSFKVMLGKNLNLVFQDSKSGKTTTGVPSSLSSDTKAGVKELSKAVKNTFKAQTERLEALMVRQTRWSVASWVSLYPVHPLLRLLSSRLVWGAYDADKHLRQTFRTLEDGSLSDLNDAPVSLDGFDHIGLVHPLELSEAQRQLWMQHLIDYEVSQPFPQMARTFIRPAPNELQWSKGPRFDGAAMGALVFRGRALRAGWRRASVGDGGMIGHYVKRMPESRVDAWLEIDGLYFGSGPDDQVRLGDFFFLPSSNPAEAESQYPPSYSTEDKRLIPFGSVPPIAYSEAIADLIKISGKNAEAETPAE